MERVARAAVTTLRAPPERIAESISSFPDNCKQQRARPGRGEAKHETDRRIRVTDCGENEDWASTRQDLGYEVYRVSPNRGTSCTAPSLFLLVSYCLLTTSICTTSSSVNLSLLSINLLSAWLFVSRVGVTCVRFTSTAAKKRFRKRISLCEFLTAFAS